MQVSSSGYIPAGAKIHVLPDAGAYVSTINPDGTFIVAGGVDLGAVLVTSDSGMSRSAEIEVVTES